MQDLIDNLRKMISSYDKTKQKITDGGKEMFFWKRKKKNLLMQNETAKQIPIAEHEKNSVSQKNENYVITSPSRCQ